jgi:hypothetical protein
MGCNKQNGMFADIRAFGFTWKTPSQEGTTDSNDVSKLLVSELFNKNMLSYGEN